MSRPKVLYVITQGEWGGAQRYVFDLATNLTDEFDVAVAVGEPDGKKDLQEKLIAAQGIEVIQLRHLVRRISPFHDLTAVVELASLYKKFKPNIIHLNSSKAGIIGSLAATSYKLQATSSVIYTIHGWVFNEPLSFWKKKLYFYLEKWTAGLKQHFIVLSEKENQQAITGLGIHAQKMTIVPHGLPPVLKKLTKEKARAELITLSGIDIPLTGPWIGTIANYFKTKGLDVLIEALAQKKLELGNAICLLIGNGPERGTLNKLIRDYKLEKTVFLIGNINEAWNYLPAFDVFALPSRKEGLPYALLEALAYQLPVVATDVGGISAYLENKKTGLLVQPDSPLALGEALVNALKNPGQFLLHKPAITLADEVAQTAGVYQSFLTTWQT